jgi:transcription antitermination factor NusG
MALTPTVTMSNSSILTSPHSPCEEHWYAAYTCANHEKCVASQLSEREIQYFLPVYRSVRRWSDRFVESDRPLFPGYVFVRLVLRDRLRVLQIPGVARFVGFNGLPAALPEEEMDILRSALSPAAQVKPHPFLTVGRRVRITGGPFAGLTGVLKRHRNRVWVVVSIDMVQRSIMISVQSKDLTALI